MFIRSRGTRFGIAVLGLALTLLAVAGNCADMKKVLRISSNDITSLDPQQGTDLYSTRVTSSIFEALYQFEYLSSGSKVVPNTADGMPVVTSPMRLPAVSRIS